MALELREADTLLGTYPERTTRRITANVVDENGDAVAGSSLTTMTLTLYSEHGDRNILNSRDDDDILSSVSESGVLSLLLTPADMAIENDDLLEERHRLLFEWSYSSGREGRHEMQLVVSNMLKVP